MNKKIKSFKEVCKITADLKQKNRKIIFVHGIFDILHRGHVTMICEAKKLGDILVVGIDHDDNAKILKGPGRPINDHGSRMFVVSNLEAVDFVFLIPSFKKVKNALEINKFCQKMYMELKPDIVATSVRAGKHGQLKKEQAKAAGAKFVDINHAFYKQRTSRVIKILGLD